MPIDDLVRRKNILTNYIIQDDKTVEDIARADGNLDNIKQVLTSKSIDPFIVDIINSSQYDSWVREVANDILNKNRGLVKRISDERLGIEVEPKVDKIKKIKVKKGFKSKTESGITYKKSYVKYTKSEEIFLKTRIQNDTKDIIEEYVNVYGASRRSVSSIRTKISRLKK